MFQRKFPNKDITLIIGCSDGKSYCLDALDALDEAGYANLVALKGGYYAWFRRWDNNLRRCAAAAGPALLWRLRLRRPLRRSAAARRLCPCPPHPPRASPALTRASPAPLTRASPASPARQAPRRRLHGERQPRGGRLRHPRHRRRLRARRQDRVVGAALVLSGGQVAAGSRGGGAAAGADGGGAAPRPAAAALRRGGGGRRRRAAAVYHRGRPRPRLRPCRGGGSGPAWAADGRARAGGLVAAAVARPRGGASDSRGAGQGRMLGAAALAPARARQVAVRCIAACTRHRGLSSVLRAAGCTELLPQCTSLFLVQPERHHGSSVYGSPAG
jgi:hypothetical protein